MGSVDPNEIVHQRELGWPDFHPEDYCHRCGRRNPVWTCTEFTQLHGSPNGILCPPCFAEYDPDAIWSFERWHPPDEDQVAALAAHLRTVTSLSDDAERVARCIVDSGWRR